MDPDELNVSSNCFTAYEQLRRDKKYRYLVLYVHHNEIEIEKIGDRGHDHEQFLKDLQRGGPDTCRCGLYDVEYSVNGPGNMENALTESRRQNLVLFLWSPLTATFKNRTTYGRVFNVLRRSFAGVQACFKATDLFEASRDGIIKQLKLLELQG